MLSSTVKIQSTHARDVEFLSVFQRQRMKCVHEDHSKRNVLSFTTLSLRGGDSEVVGRLKDFQTKASLILRSVGGTMNSTAFVKRWAEVFLGDDLQR